VDGEIQADVAVLPDVLSEEYPFARIKGGANCLVFPDLDAANIGYRLLRGLGGMTMVGPVLCGLDMPMHVIERGASPEQIVNIAAIGAVQAQSAVRAGAKATARAGLSRSSNQSNAPSPA
jgi:malate dehydrogenase (oxaloacetate-decarboxylating)(NADP+)